MEQIGFALLRCLDVRGASNTFAALSLKEANCPRDRREKLKFSRLARHCAALASWHEQNGIVPAIAGEPIGPPPPSTTVVQLRPPRTATQPAKNLMADLADCVVNELVTDGAVFGVLDEPTQRAPPSVDRAQIQKSFSKLLLVLHPDKNTSLPADRSTAACASLTKRRNRLLETIESKDAGENTVDNAGAGDRTTRHVFQGDVGEEPLRSEPLRGGKAEPPPPRPQRASSGAARSSHGGAIIEKERIPVVELKEKIQSRQLDALLGSLRLVTKAPISLTCDLSMTACSPTAAQASAGHDEPRDAAGSSAGVGTATVVSRRCLVSSREELDSHVKEVLSASLSSSAPSSNIASFHSCQPDSPQSPTAKLQGSRSRSDSFARSRVQAVQ